MKVNSMAGAIMTPIKNNQKPPSCLVRVPNNLQKRFSPTKAVQDQLLKIDNSLEEETNSLKM